MSQGRTGQFRKGARTRRIERRETYSNLLMSGYSVPQIAKAMGLSTSAVRPRDRSRARRPKDGWPRGFRPASGRAAQQGASLRGPGDGSRRHAGDPAFLERRRRPRPLSWARPAGAARSPRASGGRAPSRRGRAAARARPRALARRGVRELRMSGRRPEVKGFVEALRTGRVRSCLRPVGAG